MSAPAAVVCDAPTPPMSHPGHSVPLPQSPRHTTPSPISCCSKSPSNSRWRTSGGPGPPGTPPKGGPSRASSRSSRRCCGRCRSAPKSAPWRPRCSSSAKVRLCPRRRPTSTPPGEGSPLPAPCPPPPPCPRRRTRGWLSPGTGTVPEATSASSRRRGRAAMPVRVTSGGDTRTHAHAVHDVYSGDTHLFV